MGPLSRSCVARQWPREARFSPRRREAKEPRGPRGGGGAFWAGSCLQGQTLRDWKESPEGGLASDQFTGYMRRKDAESRAQEG